MSFLTYNEIIQLVEDGNIIGADLDRVNSGSIDVHLSNDAKVEARDVIFDQETDQLISFQQLGLDQGKWIVEPGSLILVSTVEVFNLPLDIGAVLRLRSSIATKRGFALAGAEWGDPGWSNGAYTVAMQNRFQYHASILTPGEAFAQVIFLRADQPSPEHRSYAKLGNYNNTPTIR
jgi:deoxycytidine triphosphate deaminase